MIRAVLFDMDGTILDSEDFITWSFLEASRIVGVEVDEDAIRRNIGRPLEEFSSLVFGGLGREKHLELMRVRAKLVEENWKRMIRVFDDVPGVLGLLRSKGFRLAVASSSKLERIVEYLGYFNILGLFDTVSGVVDGVRGKPYPDVILRALSAMGVGADEAVYVGDREVDCLAARSAGVGFVLVNRNNYRYDQGVCRPDYAVESLRPLPDLLLYINKK
ncbi:HAD family hydrolase [Thermogladius sp.]|uniref:HAD family hydrolase n=1 Tax=Thermogladius sp. TaxID=2023064 RepID=UPI003D0C9655